MMNKQTVCLDRYEDQEGGKNRFCCCNYIVTTGEFKTLDYKIYIGTEMHGCMLLRSPFHGINLFPNYADRGIVNMIVEIPQGSQEKMEINKNLPLNPIMYDVSSDKIRLVTYQAQGSKYHGYPFHYGALPMTWESTEHPDRRTKKPGDNDPIDCFDISQRATKTGTVKQVKILGAFAMIDNNETDWKLISIDVADPNAMKYNDWKDVPKNIINIIYDFLENYKTVDGKPKNEFAEKIIYDRNEAIKIIQDVHKDWFNLVTKNQDMSIETERIINYFNW